jgi:hypothetical protein
MYTTCLFCHADLGRNEVVDAFPVGRRLAFDAAKGRLWVVCRNCERWNLTPLEERWEAIEQCERAFAGTRLRVSTDNIGMARLREGLELVRIGAPQRPEMAAWRYGDQFGRRRRRFIAMSAGAVAVGGVVLLAGPVAGLVGTGAITPLVNIFNAGHSIYRARRKLRLPLADGSHVETNLANAASARLTADGEIAELHVRLAPPGIRTMGSRWDAPWVTLRGEDAMRGAGVLLPHLNRSGGGAVQVRDAVKLLEDASSVETLYRDTAREARRRFESGFWNIGDPGTLRRMPAAMRLALEMAAHEEQERRALEGELSRLERAWQEAEEIAHIADGLLVPESVDRDLRRLRDRDDER